MKVFALAEIGSEAPGLAALKRLRRLEWCLKEAERLYPPLVMLMRWTSNFWSMAVLYGSPFHTRLGLNIENAPAK